MTHSADRRMPPTTSPASLSHRRAAGVFARQETLQPAPLRDEEHSRASVLDLLLNDDEQVALAVWPSCFDWLGTRIAGVRRYSHPCIGQRPVRRAVCR